MHLLHTSPLPSPEFVSLSLVLQPDPIENPHGCGMGEPLMLASPVSTIHYSEAMKALQELHSYLCALLSSPYHSSNNAHPQQISVKEQLFMELMHEDAMMVECNKLQVFRPLHAHGMALHYRLLRENNNNNSSNKGKDQISTDDFSSLVLAASRLSGGKVDSEDNKRKAEKNIIGVLLCVGLSGLPYAHCSSSLQYQLSQRVNDCVGLLSNSHYKIANDVSAAKIILSTLLAAEDEVRKTNEVADAAHVTAILESGEDSGLGQQAVKKKSKLKSTKRVMSSTINIATLGLLNRGISGETSIHVGLGSTSNDLSRAVMDRLSVLSIAEDDSILKPYETSGQQRKANLDLTGNKSRFRKRKTDSVINADLENFDYKGPARATRPDRLRQGPLRNEAQQQQQQQQHHIPPNIASSSSSTTTPPQASRASSVSASKGHHHHHPLRHHKSDTPASSSRRNKQVPILSAPRGDISSSRRSSIAALRSEDHEDDARSRRSGKSQGSTSRRATADVINTKLDVAAEDMSETTPSISSSGTSQRIQVNVALNEDLTCSYKFSKMTSCSVEGVIQVQVKSNARSVAPFQLIVRDPSSHIQTLQENKKFAEETAVDAGNRAFTIGVPKAETYFPLIRYKCSSDLRPVPIRVQTRIKVDGGYCRVALQISSNPHNEGSLTDLTIIMGVANDIKGESLVTQPTGGVWNASKRSVIWCVSELGDGEKFQLQARFEMDPDSAAGRDDSSELPKFPVLVRCQCMYAQLSDVEVAIRDLPDVQPAEVAMKVARRFRLSHQERS